jgi:uncharacterized SAM-binding protein YcdF (DUF218 family)
MKKIIKLSLLGLLSYFCFVQLVNTVLIKDDKPQEADYIVVISGGDTYGRTKKGIELYKQAYAPKLLLSGDAADTNSPSNAEVMKNVAIQSGVKAEDIITEENSKNTTQNAKESIAKIIKSGPKQKIILVTSPYHSRRAKLEFEKAFKAQTIQASVISVVAEDKYWGTFWWLRPRAIIISILELVKAPFL